MQEYFDRAKCNKPSRHVDSFIVLMGEKFRRPTEELALLRVEQWNEMKRKPSEGFKSYWIRMERLHHKLMDLGIIWPQKVAFQKAFTSLGMSKEQQTLTRAALELCNPPDSIMELKRIATKLFDNQLQEVEEVCYAKENSDVEEEEEETEWNVSKMRG